MINLLIPDLIGQLRGEPGGKGRFTGIPEVQASAPTHAPRDVLVPGQRVLATVLEVLGNGRYIAQTGTTRFTLDLPEQAAAGDTLHLQVTRRTADHVVARRLPEPAGGAMPPPGHATADAADLSPAARLISRVLSETPSDKPAAARAAAPALPAPPADGPALAPELKTLTEKSGLFYESHLKAWTEGRLPLAELHSEPQARAQETAPHPSRTGPAPSDAPTARQDAAVRLDDAIVPLVHRQLDALATRQIQWQGELWPGMPLEWEIQEEPEHPSSSPDAPDRNWSTRIRTHLPHLGEIQAVITLSGPHAHVSVRCEASVRLLLDAAAGELGTALSRARVHLAGFSAADDV